MIEFIDIYNANIEECYKLALEELAQAEAFMRVEEEYKNNLLGAIHWMVDNCKGVALIEDGALSAYIAGISPIDDFFGCCQGAFVPLGFSAAKDESTLSICLAEYMRRLYPLGITSFALTRITDLKANKALIYNSFGIRNEEAILTIKNYSYSEEYPMEFKEIIDLNEIKEPFDKLCCHLDQSPCFCSSPIDCFNIWNKKEGLRVFGGYINNTLIGYYAVCYEGESYLGTCNKRINICGAYTIESYRGTGFSKALLDNLVKYLDKEGYLYLGVDYETINPTAFRFWGKYFQVYTESFHRRVDETIYLRDYKNKKVEN